MDLGQFKTLILPGTRTKHIFTLDKPLSLRDRLAFVLKGYFPKRMQKIPFRIGKGVVPRDFIRLEPWEAEYLFILGSRAREGIVEIGRFNGGSSLVFSCANTNVPIYSIDIGAKDDNRLSNLLDEIGYGKNLKLVTGDSQKGTFADVPPFDLLFIDGDHSYEGCLADLVAWYPRLKPGGHVVLHDCYFSSPVQNAILDYIADKKVRLFNNPYRVSDHYLLPEGSICHFMKLDEI
jgi:predicted O-methyltransferase YrrM